MAKTYDEIKADIKAGIKKAQEAAEAGVDSAKEEFESLKADIIAFKESEETAERKEAWKEAFDSLKGAAKETWGDLSDSVKREVDNLFNIDDDNEQ